MAPFLRKVTTESGATAVQIVEKVDRKNRVIEHLGSAHTDLSWFMVVSGFLVAGL